ncbi:hypothetical protein GC176_03300 [bacterium]|nr:hypothetical protein [bacterium]
MANWLDKALGRKTTTTSVAIVPFDVRCECGARLTGVRAERARRAICAQCGEAHFILPVNQYPESKRTFFSHEATADKAVEVSADEPSSASPASEVPPADVYALNSADLDEQAAIDDEVDLGLDFDDAEDGAPGSNDESWIEEDDSDDMLDFLDEPVDPPKRRRKPRRDSLDEIPDGAPVPERSEEAEPSRRPSKADQKRSRSKAPPSGMIELTRESGGWGESRRRVVLVVSGILLLAVATIWWAIRSQTVDHAEARLVEATDNGQTALEKGDFVDARLQLQTALDALDVIGADAERIAPVRQMWLEADVASRLLDGSLIDIVEATQEARDVKRVEWQKQFDVLFADRWLLLDVSPVETVRCAVRSKDDEKESVETRLLFPWIVDDKPVQIAGVESLISGGRSRVVLAGQLVGSEFDDNAQAWVVRVDPKTSFLWTRFSTLVQLGFAEEEDAALRQLLKDQGSQASDSTTIVAAGPTPDEPQAAGQETQQ